jgi:beta-lactamase regulating signal transducer with metallopeptidase domain
MATDILQALLRANLAASAAILLVLLARAPARRLFGAELAYALWLLVPAAMAGALLTFSTRDGLFHPPASNAVAQAPRLLTLWLAGAFVGLAWALFRQIRFLIAAKAGRAGPAVVGVIHARMVLPADFADRFSLAERELICAHERAHIDRLDARANALAVLIQCLGWFNPLLHLGGRAMRLDQELACDAAVMARRPGSRRRYAETLLKTQGAALTLPLGCRWVARGRHPLETRITALAHPAPSPQRQDIGLAVLLALALTATCAARAAQPPQPPWPALLITWPMAVLIDIDTQP